MKTARLLLLDVESADAAHALRDDELAAYVPAGLHKLAALRLSAPAFAAPPVVRHGPNAQAVEWRALGPAVLRLVEAARAQRHLADAPTHTLVAGHAPLPVFVLAGYELSSWAGDVTFVNRRDDGTWDVLRPEAPAPRATNLPFDAVSKLPDEPSLAPGLVAVFVSTRGTPANRDGLQAFCRQIGQPMAGVVELRSADPLTVDEGNVRVLAEQLRSTLARVHDLFPKRDGLVVFVAGPASLGFLVGRALRPLHGVVHVPNYVSSQRGYERAFTLPWGAPPATATVLFIYANPEKLQGPLALDEEVRAIREKVRAAQYRDALKLEMCPAARSDDLIQALNQHRPSILHVSGHGTSEGIVLLDDAGEEREVPRHGLVRLLRQFTDDVRLVLLNTCSGQEHLDALTEVVDCAIGMPPGAYDDAARTFSASFYRALGFGCSVKDAFEQALSALEMESWPPGTAPTLVTRLGVDASTLFLVSRDATGAR